MRQHHAGLARQKSTCTLSWVDARGRGVGLRGGDGVDPDKHASFSVLTVVFMDGRAFHCCLSLSLLALVSALDTISWRDAISRAGCGFPALAPVSLLTAVCQADCCFSRRLLFLTSTAVSHVDCCFSRRLLFLTSTAVSHVDCCFSRRLLFLTSTAVSHVDCCFPGSVSFSGLNAVLSIEIHFMGIDIGFQQQLLFPCSVSLSVSSAVFNVDCGF